MESPNAEYRGFESRNEIDHLSDQYKSMRELLKVYGLNVTEGPITENLDEVHHSNKKEITAATHVLETDKAHPLSHYSPSELLRNAFTEQLSSQWLEICRNNNRLNMDSPQHNRAYSNNNIGGGTSTATTISEESSQFPENLLKRFESATECGEIDCVLQQLRDHFHCEDRYCVRESPEEVAQQSGRRYLKTFCKKEEIVRHCKWHKKRAETLKFGFLRFSCMDDCKLNGFSGGCQFNGKQTHYHCIETGCDKVYISTSDVQMHANYHRKTNAIKMQGFLRVRNLETCQEPSCPYANQQTTHFHCLRDGCQFTFKNKGEMEKHKVYHLKDEQLLSDGFKKFFKADKCKFQNCRYDGKLNHIHCIRPNCNYVFHSSGQLTSHKRKHEKNDQNKDANAHIANEDGEVSSADNSNLLDLSIGGGKSRAEGQCRNANKSPTRDFTPLAGQLPLLNAQLASHVTLNATPTTSTHNSNVLQITSIDGLFNRKRGRPPKNRFVEVYNSSHARTSYSPDHHVHSPSHESPQAIFASFKLDKSVTASSSKEQPEGSPGRIKKKPRLMEHNIVGGRTETKPVGLIKSTGIFYPNTATAAVKENLSLKEEESNSSESNGDKQDVNGETDEEGEEVNGKTNMTPNPFRSNTPNHCQHQPQLSSSPFVPNIFPINTAAIENNNRDGNGAPNLGMEWLKYAYQQPNPMMVFATAALLAASMNPVEPSLMDPSIMEYAKSMFLYNNFQQQQQHLTATSAGVAANGHPSGNREPLNSISESSLAAESDGGGEYQSRGVCNYSKDEAIPTGYLKFRFNEDCQFETCGYRNHQSHFHCLRDNCYYSFCDKTRFVQHTARHERLDKLMGNDFKQYRSNMNCGYEGCEYMLQNHRLTEDDDPNASAKVRNSSKSSHFHCQKCDYICTDTNKVVAHRRQHNKTDFIRLSGFRKVASSEPCYNDESPSPESTTAPSKCHYSGKQTHYHCLVCNSVVLNRSQLAVHRHKGQPKGH